MGILANVILVLVIGFTVIVTACAIIQKIYDVKQKSNERAGEIMSEVFDELPKMILATYDELNKREEEKRAKSTFINNVMNAIDEKME